MNAFELLLRDHRKVSELFEQIENSSDPAVQETMFSQLKQELIVHTEIEEKYFYPFLIKFLETEELTVDSIEDHQEIKDLLSELDEISPNDDDWENTIRDLIDAIEHHVKLEENELFPKAQNLLNDETLIRLTEELQAAKQKIMQIAI